MIIDSISLSQLRNGEFINYITDLIAILRKHEIKSPFLKAQADKFEPEVDLLNKVFAPERGSKLSFDIELADYRRDEAISGIKQVVSAYTRHFDANTKAAAEALLRGINKYGSNLATQNYMQETTSLSSLSDDFETNADLKAALILLGLGAWAGELKTANVNFNSLYLKRTEENSLKPELTVKTQRGIVKDKYDVLADYISAYQKINPSDDLLIAIREVNSHISQYNRLLAGRTSSGSDTEVKDSPE